ncbi:redoxin family protein [Sinomicrobium soli]|uniref:redoxin family protein n=1 Tax=Sinomicrobium sp. N-1-3-6 TaxID=2219864 RepID=UPI00137512C2|nr:thioredoxin-like domain-containing protein [Sinomicrobium sp. N-1-3-6]
MKKTIYILLVMTLVLVSCKQTGPVDYALVSGNITGKEGELTLMSEDRTFSKTLESGKDGSFSDTIRTKPGHFFLRDGKNVVRLYLAPGNEVRVNADAGDFDNTLSFSGKDAASGRYLKLKGKTITDLTGDMKSFYAQDETAYREANKGIGTALEKILDSMPGLDEGFIRKEKRNLHYEYLNALNIYQNYYAHFADDPDFKVSDGFLDELAGMDYNLVEDYNFSSSYRQLLQDHYRERSGKLSESDSLPGEIAYMKVLTTIPDETIRNGLLFGHASNNITFVSDLEAYYSIYASASTDEENNAVIKKSYEELKALSGGNPSPVFSGYENYEGGTTSLNDLRGKYVYIDVWATWCGPCKAEIPFLKEVEEEYRDRNVEFVSISVDRNKDRDKWKAMIAEKELKGVQLLADKDWESDFVKAYVIKGIPKFILIDPEGKIVSSNAPRPSDPELKKLFEEVL